jgi:hypothetical protein
MKDDIAQDYAELSPNQKSWFDKRVAGLEEPVQREWLLYVKVEETLNKDGVAIRFNHDMSGFYFTYVVKATDTWHTFFPFQGWEDDEGRGGVTYQCVEDAEEKAHETIRDIDVQSVNGLSGWLKDRIKTLSHRLSPIREPEMTNSKQSCPDCGVSAGSMHTSGCDMEQCPNCGSQLIRCSCSESQRAGRLPWPGDWPGIAECREFGWYAKMVPGVGWVSCGPDEPGAAEDLNRLAMEAEWDPLQMCYVPKGE